jgi:hypothetical protein
MNSSSSDEGNDAVNFTRREGRTGKMTVKEFVFLKSKVSCVPRGGAWRDLENEGRRVGVSTSHTSQQIEDQLKANIPLLANVNFNRYVYSLYILRIYRF